MVFQIDLISLGIGAGVVFIIMLFILVLTKKKKKEPTKTSLPTLRTYIKNAHNELVEVSDKNHEIHEALLKATDNLIKLYEVFNDIDSKQ